MELRQTSQGTENEGGASHAVGIVGAGAGVSVIIID